GALARRALTASRRGPDAPRSGLRPIRGGEVLRTVHHRVPILPGTGVDTSGGDRAMTAVMDRTCPRPPGRRDAFLLVAALPLFLGALLCGWAYGSSEQIQWSNFASWLIAGGLVFAGIALACALVDLLHAGRRRGRFLVYFVLLLGTFAAG